MIRKCQLLTSQNYITPELSEIPNFVTLIISLFDISLKGKRLDKIEPSSVLGSVILITFQ